MGVVGLKERNTKKVSALVIEQVGEETLKGFIADRITKDTAVYTDGAYEYRDMNQYEHECVNHSQGEYVRGMASQNVLELMRWGTSPFRFYISLV